MYDNITEVCKLHNTRAHHFYVTTLEGSYVDYFQSLRNFYRNKLFDLRSQAFDLESPDLIRVALDSFKLMSLKSR